MDPQQRRDRLGRGDTDAARRRSGQFRRQQNCENANDRWRLRRVRRSDSNRWKSRDNLAVEPERRNRITDAFLRFGNDGANRLAELIEGGALFASHGGEILVDGGRLSSHGCAPQRSRYPFFSAQLASTSSCFFFGSLRCSSQRNRNRGPLRLSSNTPSNTKLPGSVNTPPRRKTLKGPVPA